MPIRAEVVVVAVGGLAARLDLEQPVLEPGVVRQIPLQLVVAPTRRQADDAAVADEFRAVARREEPGLRIELCVVEFVTPDQHRVHAGHYFEVIGDRQGRVVDVDVGWWFGVRRGGRRGFGIRRRHRGRVDLRKERGTTVIETGRDHQDGKQW